MSELIKFIERNVKDISYDFIGLILPGIIVNIYIIARIIYNYKLVTINQIEQVLEIMNNSLITILFIIFAYFTGLVLHSLYCLILKRFEKANSKYNLLINKNIRELKTLCGKLEVENAVEGYDGILRKLLYLIQKSDENNYITKYLAKRVMYRVMVMGLIGVLIEYVLIVPKMNCIFISLIVFVLVSLFYMIGNYTNRIVKEITYSSLSKLS